MICLDQSFPRREIGQDGRKACSLLIGPDGSDMRARKELTIGAAESRTTKEDLGGARMGDWTSRRGDLASDRLGEAQGFGHDTIVRWPFKHLVGFRFGVYVNVAVSRRGSWPQPGKKARLGQARSALRQGSTALENHALIIGRRNAAGAPSPPFRVVLGSICLLEESQSRSALRQEFDSSGQSCPHYREADRCWGPFPSFRVILGSICLLGRREHALYMSTSSIERERERDYIYRVS